MTIPTYNTQQDVVKELRRIREQISNEIKDMTFEEERAFLDQLLTRNGKSAPHTGVQAMPETGSE
jgi:hypothetical protein